MVARQVSAAQAVHHVEALTMAMKSVGRTSAASARTGSQASAETETTFMIATSITTHCFANDHYASDKCQKLPTIPLSS